MSLHDPWTALRHGGNLLSPAALDGLPATDAPSRGLADRLRAALVGFDPEHPAAGTFGVLLDVVFEDACGLPDGWEKGNAIGAAHTEKLLDGTVLKPRRVWSGGPREPLAVFTTTASRIGVGKGRRPFAQVVEYLRRRALTLGILTNGAQWRLVWADPDSLAWVEWEADRWLEADKLSTEFAVLRRVLSVSALERDGALACPLVAAIRDTRRGQARLSKELGERVRRAVETLLKSRAPLLGPAWDDHGKSDLYVAASHFVMRFVVALFAEARELLPTDNPVYHQAYGLRGMLDQLDRLTPERRRGRHSAWPRLLALFRLLHAGSPHPAVTLPAYGGDLFRPGEAEGDAVQRALALIEALLEPPDDDVVHRLLVLLTRTTQKVREGSGWRTVSAPVDFSELTSEYIGILYEGLLDYELHRAGSDPIVFLNLGDQPALPLDRLESMDDKALKALVEKAKVKRLAAAGEEDGEEDDEGEGGAAAESEDLDDGDAEGDADEPVVDADPDNDTPDDVRATARARALAWGRRAAEVGGLVKKPKGKKADAAALYTAQLDHAAEQLVADLKLPGELYLVRWGGTRKGAGTFYTRPQLTLPTVRRTLEPLIYQQPGDDGTERLVRPPETLLALKVCDPAMGSGSFLVAALRVLTTAVVESLHVHGRIERVNGRTTIACELLPDADRSLPTEGFDERLEAIVRRSVVEHCLYGVDLDPLAVELARVALWVETLDKRLPFTFLDHKLRCGDSLVGGWFKDLQDYPFGAWERESADKGWEGVNHPANRWHSQVVAMRDAAQAQAAEYRGRQASLFGDARPDDFNSTMARVRRLFREMRRLPVGRPDLHAEFWRTRIQGDESIAHMRRYLDAWCAVWFWPSENLHRAPLPGDIAGRALDDRVIVEVSRVRRFFHWELNFPDIQFDGGGFDAVVGNPPWETVHSQMLEFFSNLDPMYRGLPAAQARVTRERLYSQDPRIEEDWLASIDRVKTLTNWARETGQMWGRPFRLQGKGKPYTHRLFLELAIRLTRDGGRIGLVLPSSVATEKGSVELRKELLDQNRIEWFYDFQNSREIFPIHRSSRFASVIAQRGGTTASFFAAVMVSDVEQWGASTPDCMQLSASLVRRSSPDDYSFPLFESEHDTRILQVMSSGGTPFRGDGGGPWGIQYSRELNMSDDKRLFTRRDALQPNSTLTLTGDFVTNGGVRMVPLLEGRNIGQFHLFSQSWVSGNGRGSKWDAVAPGTTATGAQYYLKQEQCSELGKVVGTPKVAVMDVTGVTNSRSIVASCCSKLPSGHSVNMAFFPSGSGRADRALALCAVLNSWPFDWVVRQRLTGQHVSRYFLKDLPLPNAAATLAVAPTVLRLNGTHPWFAGWWCDEASSGPAYGRGWAITPHERLRLRAMLDAIVACLYGLDRDDLAWIVKDCDHPTSRTTNKAFCRQLDPKGFWRVDKTEAPELRHAVLSLAAFDDLQAIIAEDAAGDRDAGIQAFCDQHDGDGWMLPEALCLADLGLTRTVDVGIYDDRARTPQPVRSRMGERFLDWQLAQTPEESCAECERHAKAIHEGAPAPAAPTSQPAKTTSDREQYKLFDDTP